MIRDPSDGTVKQPAEPEAIPVPEKPPLIHAGTSGLPFGSTKPENVARLEASRCWLKEYHASRNPEKVVRAMGEGNDSAED